MTTRMERPTAHLALVPGRRRDRRRSLSPRKVSVVAAPVAAWGAVAAQVGVALSLARLAAAGAGLAGDRGEPGPADQVGGGGEPGHVQARFGDDGAGEVQADARDLREPFRGREHRGTGAGIRGPCPGGVNALRGGDGVQGRGDVVLDRGDGPVQERDVVQVDPGEPGAAQRPEQAPDAPVRPVHLGRPAGSARVQAGGAKRSDRDNRHHGPDSAARRSARTSGDRLLHSRFGWGSFRRGGRANDQPCPYVRVAG